MAQLTSICVVPIEMVVDPVITKVLQQFSEVFEEPKGLQPNSALVNVRPYRYPYI